jgi:hypothetical protein
MYLFKNTSSQLWSKAMNVYIPPKPMYVLDREELEKMHAKEKQGHPQLKCHTVYLGDPKQNMKALQWLGKENLQVKEVPKPLVTDPHDCVVRITTVAICGVSLVTWLLCLLPLLSY